MEIVVTGAVVAHPEVDGHLVVLQVVDRLAEDQVVAGPAAVEEEVALPPVGKY